MKFRHESSPMFNQNEPQGGEPEWAKQLGARLDKLEAASKPPAASSQPNEPKPPAAAPQTIPAPSNPAQQQSQSSSQTQEQEKKKPGFLSWLL